MIPSKKTRQEWRKSAENTLMISAVGEYTPDEFIMLLDAVDELENKVKQLENELNTLKKYLKNGTVHL